MPTLRNVLHRRTTGRAGPMSTLLRWPAYRTLHRASTLHARVHKQLAVFSFDHIAHHINIHGRYEDKELVTLAAWLAEIPGAFDGVAVDIGANIGNHSVFFASHYQRVLSFEANPRTCRLLSINADLCDNIEVHGYGLSDREHSANLYSNPTNSGGATLSADPATQGLPIQLKRLDDCIASDVSVKLVKIDVEGHEYEALRGGEATLRRCMPVVLFEQHESDFVGGESQVLELLRRYGYRRFATIETSPRSPSYLPRWLQGGLNVAARLAYGEASSVVETDRIKARFHPFLIAIPDWLQPPRRAGSGHQIGHDRAGGNSRRTPA